MRCCTGGHDLPGARLEVRLVWQPRLEPPVQARVVVCASPSSDTAEQACLIHERFLSRDRFWPAVKLPDSTRSTTARLGPGIESVARTLVAAEDWHRR